MLNRAIIEMKNTLEETNRRINEVKEWINELVDKMVLLERLLKIPWTTIRLNHPTVKESVLNIHQKDWLMWKLKLQYFGHVMWRTDSVGKTLMLGKMEGRRRRGQQRMRCLDGITDSMGMSLSKLGERQRNLAYCDLCSSEDSDMTWAFEQQQALKVITGIYVRNN